MENSKENNIQIENNESNGTQTNNQNNNYIDTQKNDADSKLNNNINQEINETSNIIEEKKDEKENNNNNNENGDMAGTKMDIDKEENVSNEKEINSNNINTSKGEEIKKEKSSLIRLPLAKIKNIIKLDEDIKLCQKDAYTVIGKITELFIQELARDAYTVCRSCKRKTLNMEDINSAIKMNPKMGFINFESIFHVQELNKSKKRPISSPKKISNKNKNQNQQNDGNNENENETQIPGGSKEKKLVKENKRRGKNNKKDKSVNSSKNNMTLDSIFSNK